MHNAQVVEGLLQHPGMKRIVGFVNRMSNAWIRRASFQLTGCQQGQPKRSRPNFTNL